MVCADPPSKGSAHPISVLELTNNEVVEASVSLASLVIDDRHHTVGPRRVRAGSGGERVGGAELLMRSRVGTASWAQCPYLESGVVAATR